MEEDSILLSYLAYHYSVITRINWISLDTTYLELIGRSLGGISFLSCMCLITHEIWKSGNESVRLERNFWYLHDHANWSSLLLFVPACRNSNTQAAGYFLIMLSKFIRSAQIFVSEDVVRFSVCSFLYPFGMYLLLDIGFQLSSSIFSKNKFKEIFFSFFLFDEHFRS